MANFGERPGSRLNNPNPLLRKAGLYIAVAFELPGTILGGLLIGYLLDKYLNTSPWFLIAMAVIAFVAAIVRLLQWVKFFARRANANGFNENHTAD